MWSIQTKERGVPMNSKLALLISKIDPRYISIAYFAFVLFLKVVADSPMDGGTGPT